MGPHDSKEPPYRRVRIDPEYEARAWKELVDSGTSFDHAAKQVYVITAGHCQILQKKGIVYHILD